MKSWGAIKAVEFWEKLSWGGVIEYSGEIEEFFNNLIIEDFCKHGESCLECIKEKLERNDKVCCDD